MASPSQCKSAFLTCDWFCNSEKQTLQAPGFSGFGICCSSERYVLQEGSFSFIVDLASCVWVAQFQSPPLQRTV